MTKGTAEQILSCPVAATCDPNGKPLAVEDRRSPVIGKAQALPGLRVERRRRIEPAGQRRARET